MSIVGGSMVTTEGLSRMIEEGTGIVPKYFKFSSQDTELRANLTATDIDGWIQRDITAYEQIDEQTIEFVCDVLPGDAVQDTRLCGMYLDDGTLFMIAKPVHTFPPDLRQTFRVQLVYENASDILDFQYLDLSNSDIRIQAVETTVALLDQTVNSRIDDVLTDHNTDVTLAGIRLDNLEQADIDMDNRVDLFEAVFESTQDSQNTIITALTSNRLIDVQQVNDYIQSNDIIVNNINTNLGNAIVTNDAASIARDDALGIRIDEVITNSDVGTLADDIAANTASIAANFSSFSTMVQDNTSDISTNRSDLTALINANEIVSNDADDALDTRIDNLISSTDLSFGTVNSDINGIDALIIQNKLDLDTSIQNNTDAIAALSGGIDVQAIQDQLDLLEGTVTTNNNNINGALSASDSASDTWNNIQDDAIALNTSFRTDDFQPSQDAQDLIISNNFDAQALINTDDDNRLDAIEGQLSGLPNATELTDLVTDVSEVIQLVDDIETGVVPVAKANTADTADTWTTARTVTMTGDVTGNFTLDGSQDVSFATSVQVEALPSGGSVDQILTNTAPGVGTWQDAPISYVHPSHSGNDIALNPTALTGAVVFDDINIAVTTDTLGHVVSASANATTRTLTAANIGAAASSHTHSYLPLSGGVVTGASEFQSNLQLQKLAGLTTFGDNARNSNNIVQMRVNSGYKNLLEMVTGGQGDSEIFMGQTDQHGGGFIYNADDSPDDIGTADVFSAVRTTGGVRYQQFSWHITDTDVTFNGDVIANSDIRVKDNIRVIENAMDKIEVLRGVTFNRTDLGDTETRMTGVIAQEVQAVLPEAVKADQDGKLSVAYGNMVGLLIEGMKEQSAVIKEMQIQIDTLKEICE